MAYVEVISESDVRRIAIEEIEHALAAQRASAPWLTAATAAAHLAMSEDAVRSMVKRGQLPVHRLPNGRLRFGQAELDAWTRGARS